MSLFNTLANMALKSGGQNTGLAGMVMQNPKLMQAAMALLSNDSPVGGVQGLLGKFQSAGLGAATASWLGNGDNQPIADTDVEQVLGGDVVAQLAQQADMAPKDASQVLAMALPAMIDKLSPQGSADNMDLGSLQSMLGGFLKGKL
jgi:uncharacterized protein YidB (DUF937 family)